MYLYSPTFYLLTPISCINQLIRKSANQLIPCIPFALYLYYFVPLCLVAFVPCIPYCLLVFVFSYILSPDSYLLY